MDGAQALVFCPTYTEAVPVAPSQDSRAVSKAGPSWPLCEAGRNIVKAGSRTSKGMESRRRSLSWRHGAELSFVQILVAVADIQSRAEFFPVVDD